MNKILLMCINFFRTGLFAVGGGLATLPFLHKIAEVHPDWFTVDDLTTMVAVAESTPGPIGVNVATYAGVKSLGVSNLVRNHKLAKAISDVSWRSFIIKLQYKAAFYGKTLVLVDPKNTTQTCSVCGNVLRNDDKLTLNDRDWVCPECGTYHLRDYNSAVNILNRALEKTA